MIKASELRIGNLVYWNEPKKVGVPHRVIRIMENRINTVPISLGNSMEDYSPIPLSEGLLVAAGLDLIDENSAGKRFGFLKDMVFDSDMTFVLWKTTERAGKIFRNGKEVKFLHNLQNLFYDLTDGEELSFDLSLVGAGLNQPPAAEAIRDAGSTATKDEKRAKIGQGFVDILKDFAPSDSAITSESREADGEKLPIDSESGKEVSWQETARNFMEESGRLKAENEKLREELFRSGMSVSRAAKDLQNMAKLIDLYSKQEYSGGSCESLESGNFLITKKRISELRSELGLDK